jgi:hypothetical protein
MHALLVIIRSTYIRSELMKHLTVIFKVVCVMRCTREGVDAECIHQYTDA